MKKQIFGPILVIQADSGKIHLNLAHTSAKNRQYSTVLSMPEDAYADGILNKPDAVEELLRNALKEKHLRKAKNVIFVLNSSRVLSERVLVQPTEDKWLGKMLETNRDTYFPVDTTNCNIVWTRVGPLNVEGEGEKLLVQLWAVPEELLKPYYQIANNLKLSVLSVDFCGNSFTEAIHATYADPNASKSSSKKKQKDKRGKGKEKGKEDEKEKGKEPGKEQGKPQAESRSAAVSAGTGGSSENLKADSSENTGKKQTGKGFGLWKKAGKEKTGEAAKKAEKLYLLAERDYLLLTMVSGSQVVLQRYIQCGVRYPSELDEARLVMEGYLSRVSRRRTPEETILCGVRATDEIYVDQAEQSMGLPITVRDSELDAPQLLAEGAVRSKLDFGMPALNKPKKSRLALTFWQYLLVLIGGGILALALMTTFGARTIRADRLASLQSMVDSLTAQLAPISGYRDRWESYLDEYDMYKADWEFLLGRDEEVGTDEETGKPITVYQRGALQTYNDNLSKVLGELEQILPEDASVTEIRIEEGAIALQLACEDKEEAAWLLTVFRYDLQYADLWPDYISNLTVGSGESVFSGGISSAISQAMAAKNPAPEEGSAGEDDLAELLPDDLTEEQKAKILEIWSSMDLTEAQRQQMLERWKTVTPEQWNSALAAWDSLSAAERETVKGIGKKTMAGDKNYTNDEIAVAFEVAGRISKEDRRALAAILGLNMSSSYSLDELLQASTYEQRKAALSSLMENPFAAYELCMLMWEDLNKQIADSVLFDAYSDDIYSMTLEHGAEFLSGDADDMGALLPYLMEMPTAEEENVEATVRLIQTDSYLSSNYAYYLAVAMGRISGDPSQTNPGTNPGTPGTGPGTSPAPEGSQPPATEPGSTDPSTLPDQNPNPGESNPPEVQPTPEPTPAPTSTPNPFAGTPLEDRWEQLQPFWPVVRMTLYQQGINVDNIQWDSLNWDRFTLGMGQDALMSELIEQLTKPSSSGQTDPGITIPDIPVIPTEPPDTRTYFSVVLVYKDTLLQQELDRKVLPRDEMLPPLEVDE